MNPESIAHLQSLAGAAEQTEPATQGSGRQDLYNEAYNAGFNAGLRHALTAIRQLFRTN